MLTFEPPALRIMPGFDATVPHDGYRWWYVDGISDDRSHGITIIAFVGSVFSPYYAAARRRAPTDPACHVAINVALYGVGGHRWAMTERGAGALSRTADSFTVGPSGLRWTGTELIVDLDEIAPPWVNRLWPARVRGQVRLTPEITPEASYAIDADGRHLWHPLSPRARIKVQLDRPTLSWDGSGYWDMNAGDEPLEAGFRRWDWLRAETREGAAVIYDISPRTGPDRTLALAFAPDGTVRDMTPPPRWPLRPTPWRVQRTIRSDIEPDPRAVLTLENAPFYARSLATLTLEGEAVTALHESLDLDRFARRTIQAMLPFRMPRRA